jgi:hypothetical protein
MALNSLLSIAGDPAAIRTQHLPKQNLDPYLYISLFTKGKGKDIPVTGRGGP